MTIELQNETLSGYSADLTVLAEIRRYLFETLGTLFMDNETSADRIKPILLNRLTANGCQLRIYINNSRELAGLKDSYFVGFVGEKKANISERILGEIGRIDKVLTDELPNYPFIMAYCSLELPDRFNWINLVILKNLESLGQWKDSPFHREAARNLSPEFYENARIHVGALENNSLAPFKLIRTSHYTFNRGVTSLQHRQVH